MTGFKEEPNNNPHNIVVASQDPYLHYRDTLVSVEYGPARAVGFYQGLTKFNKLVLQPHIRKMEVGDEKERAHVFLDNNSTYVSADAVLNVESRSGAELEKLLGYDFSLPVDPACLI